MDHIDNQLQRIADTYSWYDDVQAAYPIASFFDEEACFLGTTEIDSYTTDQLTPSEWIDGAESVWLGMAIEEEYEGDLYYGEGYLSSAFLTAQSSSWLGDPTGPTLWYDEYSGQFAGDGAAGLLGLGDIPDNTTYEVSLLTEESTVLGVIDGPSPLAEVSPDILLGDHEIFQSESLTVAWTPIENSDTPQRLIIEIRVYDYEIETQAGSLELARLVTSVDPADGTLTIPSSELQKLPPAPNAVDFDDNLVGYWGEINLILHQFRSVPYANGDMVVDFATVQSAPILISP